MPLTELQRAILRLLSINRSEDSYLAGGTAIHFAPQSTRFSNDLNYFQDSVERVASAFKSDRESLEANGYNVTVLISQPGYIRAEVTRYEQSTMIDWAHDTAWRFMPTIHDPECGYRLHPVDLAVNKLLALVGRDEARDFLDILECHRETLSLGAICWAAAGKDPGLTPETILDMIKRRGKYQEADFRRLKLAKPMDLVALKNEWLDALASAENFIRTQSAEDVGCLFYSLTRRTFVDPTDHPQDDIKVHFGRLGGVIPTAV